MLIYMNAPRLQMTCEQSLLAKLLVCMCFAGEARQSVSYSGTEMFLTNVAH